MKKSFSIIFLALVLFTVSCTTEDDVSAVSLKGSYNLETINLKTKVSNEDMQEKNENMATNKIYYTFNTDGTYTTNAYWSIGEIDTKGTVSTGKYTLKDNVLSISYKDDQLGKELTQAMQVKVNNTKELVLYIGVAEVKDSLKVALSGLDLLTAALVEIYLKQLVQFDYTLSFKKV